MCLSKRGVLIAATGVSIVSLAAATFAFTLFNPRAAHAATTFDNYCETHSANCTEPAKDDSWGTSTTSVTTSPRRCSIRTRQARGMPTSTS
jgi:hypothetical protein